MKDRANEGNAEMAIDGSRRLRELFSRLAAGDIESFLSGCRDDLVLRACSPRGVTPVHRDRLAGWLAAMSALTGDTLDTRVCLTLSLDEEHVVILGHRFERDGHQRSYETVHTCEMYGGLIATWRSYPLSDDDYRRAWGTDASSVPASPRRARGRATTSFGGPGVQTD